jgi:dihydrofolate reductase
MPLIYVINHLTLDGVMQAPGRKEEDPRDGFDQGGWSVPGVDQALMDVTAARVAQAGGLRLLLGRRSYEGMLGYWNTQDSPFRNGLNDAQKYVVSRSTREPLPWPNSTLVADDVVGAVTSLKRSPGPDLCIMGSGELIRTLMAHGLIDDLTLFIHPIVLGAGRRMFQRGSASASLRLESCRTNTRGVLMARYRYEGDAR